jgi:hypothetical protein
MAGTDDFGDIIAQPFPFAAAIPGLFAQSGFSVFTGRSLGYVAAATLNTPTYIRATTYTSGTTAVQRSLVSTSSSDGPSGTGALTVTINYLNGSMVLKQDTVTLNGLTAVNTNQTDIQFIESMVVATSGSNLSNVGTVTMMSGTAGGGSAMASMAVGDSATFYAHHYVPAGLSCYIIKHTGCGTLAAGRTYMIHTGSPLAANLPLIQTGDIIAHLAGGSEDHEYIVPLVIQGPDLIIMRTNPIASATGNFEYGSFDWVQF